MCLSLSFETIIKASCIKIMYKISVSELFEILIDNFNKEEYKKIIENYLKEKRSKNSKIFFRQEAKKIMENKLGRNLIKDEVVHHKDGDFLNNSIENLQVFKNKKEHMLIGHNIIYRDKN